MNGIHIGACRRLHKLPRIGVQRFKIAALPFVKNDVKRECGLARSRRPGDHGESLRRDFYAHVFQVVLARMQDADRLGDSTRQVGRARLFCSRLIAQLQRRKIALVIVQRLAGVRASIITNGARRAFENDLAARIAALRAEVNKPIAGGDQVKIVFNHQHGVSGIDQFVKRTQQFVDVFKMQTGGRLIEHEQFAARLLCEFGFAAFCQCRGWCAFG